MQLAPLTAVDLARQRAANRLAGEAEGQQRRAPRSLAPLSLEQQAAPKQPRGSMQPVGGLGGAAALAAPRGSMVPGALADVPPDRSPEAARRHSDPTLLRMGGGGGSAARGRRRFNTGVNAAAKDMSLLQLVDRFRTNTEESVPRS